MNEPRIEEFYRDFGVTMAFHSSRWIPYGHGQKDDLDGTVLQELPELEGGVSGPARVQICDWLDRRALRLTIRLPVFDLEDRETDSWHRLFLVSGAEAGTVDAYYFTGGYEVVQSVYYQKLLEIPAELREALHCAEVI